MTLLCVSERQATADLRDGMSSNGRLHPGTQHSTHLSTTLPVMSQGLFGLCPRCIYHDESVLFLVLLSTTCVIGDVSSFIYALLCRHANIASYGAADAVGWLVVGRVVSATPC